MKGLVGRMGEGLKAKKVGTAVVGRTGRIYAKIGGGKWRGKSGKGGFPQTRSRESRGMAVRDTREEENLWKNPYVGVKKGEKKGANPGMDGGEEKDRG